MGVSFEPFAALASRFAVVRMPSMKGCSGKIVPSSPEISYVWQNWPMPMEITPMRSSSIAEWSKSTNCGLGLMI